MSEAEQFPPNLKAHIGGVPVNRIDLVWPRVARLFQRIDKAQVAYLYGEMKAGKIQLWVVNDFEGVVGTSIEHRQYERVLFVDFLAGQNLRTWLDDWITVMETFARSHMCDAVEFRGRRGWRIFERRHQDYKPKFTIYRKELS
jgi:hypothetical protein